MLAAKNKTFEDPVIKWGRRVGSMLFWLMVVYILVVAFVSLIPQVFGGGGSGEIPDCCQATVKR